MVALPLTAADTTLYILENSYFITCVVVSQNVFHVTKCRLVKTLAGLKAKIVNQIMKLL
jgi:hypothetical protein